MEPIGGGSGELLALKEAITNNQTELVGRLQKQQEEIAALGETKTATASQIEKFEQQLAQLAADAKGAEEKNAQLQDELKAERKRVDELEKEGKRLGFGDPEGGHEDPASAFFDNEEIKSMVKDKKLYTSRTISVKGGFRQMRQKASLRTDIVEDWVRPDRLERVFEQRRNLTIRDVLPSSPTSSNAFEYYVRTMNALTGSGDGTLTFGAAAGVAEGAASPEVEYKWVKKTGRIVRRAHYVPATLQMLQDDPSTRGIINDDLLYGLDYDVEQQLVYGDGLDENLPGLVTNAGQTYAWSDGTPRDADKNIIGDTKLDAIRKAMTKAQVLHYQPDFLVINPNDWQDIELLKGSDGHYIWLQIGTGNQPRFFQLTAIVTTAINPGDGLLGSSMAARVLDRQEDDLRTTDAHGDLFLKGIYVIEASTRLGVQISQPNAIVDIDLSTAPTPIS